MNGQPDTEFPNDTEFHYDEGIDDKVEFKGAMFSIAIEDSELDDILTTQDQIMIKQDFDCYCFHKKREPRYFHIKRQGSKSLTNRCVIHQLIEQKMVLECNHVFLEGFIKKTDCQFELGTSS